MSYFLLHFSYNCKQRVKGEMGNLLCHVAMSLISFAFLLLPHFLFVNR
jgi:hypothetical protein